MAEAFSPNGPERSRARRQGAAKPPLTARTVRRPWAKREWLPGAWDTVSHTQSSILSRHFEGEVSENRARREFENIGERIAVRYINHRRLMPMKKYKIALMDDYQNVALKSADWSVLRDRADITVF